METVVAFTLYEHIYTSISPYKSLFFFMLSLSLTYFLPFFISLFVNFSFKIMKNCLNVILILCVPPAWNMNAWAIYINAQEYIYTLTNYITLNASGLPTVPVKTVSFRFDQTYSR